MTRHLVVVGVLVVLSVSLVVGVMGNDVEVDGSTEPVPTATVTVLPTQTPEPTPTATPPVNRLDCEEIRGTDYHSREERRWFLANCVSN
jgi:hypothetical protein